MKNIILLLLIVVTLVVASVFIISLISVYHCFFLTLCSGSKDEAIYTKVFRLFIGSGLITFLCVYLLKLYKRFFS